MSKPKSNFWIFKTNENKEIETVIKSLLRYHRDYKEDNKMPKECSDWIVEQCENNGYEKLIGWDLNDFVLKKWKQFESKG